MSKQHLDLLPEMTRTPVGRCVCQVSSNVARVLVEVTWDFTLRRVRAAPLLKAQPWQSDLLSRVPSLVMPERGMVLQLLNILGYHADRRAAA